MRHANVSIFVPHAGCPHQCSFCNQTKISGSDGFEIINALNALEVAKNSLKDKAVKAEIAFFGGSFTAIERERMIKLLEVAKPFIEDKTFFGIRISTRPDAIDEEVLSVLKKYHVTSIELGAQSMDDEVLSLNNRGHSANDVVNACKLIKSMGFEVGLQMMTGLYGSSDEKDFKTAEKIVELSPDTVRVYPTIVLEDTYLAQLFKNNLYKEPSLESSVDLCSKILKLFSDNNINVIRVGLHSGGDVMEGYVCGPWHPAFKELCDNKIYLELAHEKLKSINDLSEVEIFVNKSAVSKMIGQKRKNIIILEEKYKIKIKVKVDNNLKDYQILIHTNSKKEG